MIGRVRPTLGLPLALCALAALALAQGALAQAGARQPTPARCAAFSSQAGAQGALAELGRRRAGGLDSDRDGIACEGLPGPYAGYATVGYSRAKRFLYGTVSMPRAGSGTYPCLYGNTHFDDGPRLLTVYRSLPGDDRAVVTRVGAEARPDSGRLLWKAPKPNLLPGEYYVAFEERVPLTPYGKNECPGFRSAEFRLPRPRG